MEPKTLEALKASIEKWKRNAVAATPSGYVVGPLDCPLCAIFQPDNGSYADACQGCPVMEKTGTKFCDGTPYRDAFDAHASWCREPLGRGLKTAARAAALVEVAFLESLLPEGEQP